MDELPPELWAKTFQMLAGEELWLCRQVDSRLWRDESACCHRKYSNRDYNSDFKVCRLWRREVDGIVRRGRVGRRHLSCKRLTYHPGDDAMEHRKALRNSLSVMVDKEVLLQGVDTYTGEDSNTLDETVPVSFKTVEHFLIFRKDSL